MRGIAEPMKIPVILLAVPVVFGIGAVAGLYMLQEPHSDETIPDELTQIEVLGANRLDATGEVLLGVAITLEKGWKTYWRLPWESGIPPLLDWTESSNLESSRALWPTPQRFDDPGGAYLGYRDALVLPIAARAIDRSQPLQAKLLLRYAVCKHVCIPLEQRLSWSVAPSDASLNDAPGIPARLEEALDRVPVEVGADDPAPIRLLDARLVGENGEVPNLEVRVAVSGRLENTLLVVEEPSPHFFGRERLVESVDVTDGTQARFSLPLLDTTVAKSIRESGARLLFNNGKHAISAHLPVQ